MSYAFKLVARFFVICAAVLSTVVVSESIRPAPTADAYLTCAVAGQTSVGAYAIATVHPGNPLQQCKVSFLCRSQTGVITVRSGSWVFSGQSAASCNVGSVRASSAAAILRNVF
jgi:hypothetical protein